MLEKGKPTTKVNMLNNTKNKGNIYNVLNIIRLLSPTTWAWNDRKNIQLNKMCTLIIEVKHK